MKKKDLAVKYGSQPQIEELTYPDGEVLSYSYDTAGQVTGITGYHYGDTQVYIADIGYDEYGQRTYIILGNNIRTDYDNDVTIIEQTDRDKGNQYENKIVKFNPLSNPSILTMQEDGSSSYERGRPSFIGLAHELIHALHSNNGVWNRERESSVVGIDGNVKVYGRPGVQYEEFATVGGISGYSYRGNYPTENSIRAEHGLKLRANY